jgi:glycosyltransferase involved in cell wall biosynthesis
MIAVMRGLLASPLASRYRLEFVATHRGAGARRRLTVFGAALWRIAWWSIRRRGRIVHVHSTVRGSMYRKALVVLLAWALGRRVVLHIHSGPGDVASFRRRMSGGRAAALRLALRRSRVALAVSTASAEELRRAFGLEQIEVLPNAAPPVAATAAGVREEAFAVFLGGFANPVKGGETMLAALEEIEPGEARFVLAGPGDLPAAGRALLESRPDVEWRGWIEGAERTAVLDLASVFILASSSEGLPMALLEAMSMGMAIAATGVGGVPDVAEDGVEAVIVPPEDPHALAVAVSALLADPGLRARLGEAARRRAAGMGADRIAERIDLLYRRLLGR